MIQLPKAYIRVVTRPSFTLYDVWSLLPTVCVMAISFKRLLWLFSRCCHNICCAAYPSLIYNILFRYISLSFHYGPFVFLWKWFSYSIKERLTSILLNLLLMFNDPVFFVCVCFVSLSNKCLYGCVCDAGWPDSLTHNCWEINQVVKPFTPWINHTAQDLRVWLEG